MGNKLVFGKTVGSHSRVHSNLQVKDPPHSDFELVASIIDKERRGWDASKVRSTFMPQEAQVILGIPISPRLPQDSRNWAWTPSGNFTVNSAYKVA